MMSNYFAKMPRDLVALLLGEDGLALDMVPESENGEELTDEPQNVNGPTSQEVPQFAFLEPFKSQSDSRYAVELQGGRRTRYRHHERLVNDCARWLTGLGWQPARNAAGPSGSARCDRGEDCRQVLGIGDSCCGRTVV